MIGQVVMRISATDIDDGSNGTVQYGLTRHPQSPGDFDYFDIVHKTGEVRLKSSIPEVRARSIHERKGATCHLLSLI